MGHKSLTTKVLLAAISAALPLAVGLMLIMTYFMNSLTDTSMLGMLQILAKTAAQNVENRLHTLSEPFFLLREHHVLQLADTPAGEKQRVMDTVSSGREYAWLGIYESDGSLLTGSDSCPRNITGRELFPLLQNTQNFVIEKTSIGTDGPEIVMGLPIQNGFSARQNGNPDDIHYLVGSYNYDVLSDVLRDINVGSTGTAFILDQNGYTIAHKDLGRIFSQESVKQNLGSGPQAERVFLAMIYRQTGASRLQTPENDLFVGYSPIKGTLWSLGIQAPRDDFMAPARNALLISAFITAAVLFAVLLLMSFFNRKVLSIPLAAITASAAQLAQGNFGQGLPPALTKREDEIGQLGVAFERMSASVHKVIEDLRDLTTATRSGALGTRTDPGSYHGDFQRIVLSMNASLDGLCSYLDNMPDALLLLDGQGNHMYHNRAMAEIMRRHGLLPGNPALLLDIFDPEADHAEPEVMRLLSQAEQDGRPYESEIILTDTQKQEYCYVASLGRVNGMSENLSVMLILNDVTQLTRARTQAEAASRAKSDFLSTMSHEMRTPMNAIIGMAAIGLGAEDSARKQYCLDKIAGASRHLLGVINDILDMAKIEADRFELSPSSCNLQEMFQRIEDVIRFQTDEKQQEFSVTVDGCFPRAVIIDEQRLAQVITNLLSNAVKFTPQEGRVTLQAEMVSQNEEACVVRISVADTGIGMSAEQKEKLFRPFVQADGSISRKFGGTGLGLAISKRIVEKMGGSISVTTELGEGSAFIFEIDVPKDTAALSSALPPDSPENTAQDVVAPEKSDCRDIFRDKRVLLAEDVALNREVIATLLEHTGLQMIFTVDGGAAVDAFLADPQGYDLILMDVHMPQVDGYEATRRIRASNAPGADVIPIIAITANVFKEDVDRCLASGMNDHLGKPINADEVIALLAKYFAKAEEARNV